MKNIRRYITEGWHVLAEIHTAIWLFGIFGISTSSIAQFLLSLPEKNYWPFLLLAQTVIWSLITVLAVGYVGYRAHRVDASTKETAAPSGVGGAGGSGTIVGNGGTIIGGRGGDGGVGGNGGHGGGGSIHGDGGLIVGGDGGNAGTADGRGGRGARSPTERMGLPTELWRFGRGGSGGNHPEYNRRIALLTFIRSEYLNQFPDEVQFIQAGVDSVPVNWINKRLEELQETWHVHMGPNGYVLPDLPRG